MTKKKQPWSELGKYQLWLAYSLKTPLKVMAQYFKRSPSSVNHALNRYHIRPLGTRSRGPLPRKGLQDGIQIPLSPKTCRQLKKIFEKCDLDLEKNKLPTYWCPINKMNSKPLIILNLQANTYLKQLDLPPTPPWQKPGSKPDNLSAENIAATMHNIFKARQETQMAHANFPGVTRAQQKQRQEQAQSVFLWITFYDVIEYLESQGVSVKRSPKHILQFSPHSSYLVDGKPLTRPQVLMRANKIRHQKKQEPFLVKSISQI